MASQEGVSQVPDCGRLSVTANANAYGALSSSGFWLTGIPKFVGQTLTYAMVVARDAYSNVLLRPWLASRFAASDSCGS